MMKQFSFNFDQLPKIGPGLGPRKRIWSWVLKHENVVYNNDDEKRMLKTLASGIVVHSLYLYLLLVILIQY